MVQVGLALHMPYLFLVIPYPYKHLVFALLLLPSVWACSQTDLFLVAGQSNARGRGNAAQSPATGDYALEYLYATDELVPLSDPVGENVLQFQSANTGSFLPALANAFHAQSGKDVILVHAARGGTSILPAADLFGQGNWSASGRLFGNALTKINSAVLRSGIPLSGIVWCQGENEGIAIADGIVTAAEYKAALIGLIDRFRQNYPGIPFYIIETGRDAWNAPNDTAFAEVRAMQQEVAAEDSLIFIAYDKTKDFIDLGWTFDQFHYTQEGYNDIGEVAGGLLAGLLTSEVESTGRGSLELRVFPNPFSDRLHLSPSTHMEEFEVQLFNQKGQEVGRQIFRNTLAWDFRQLPAGVYYLKYERGQTQRILKK